MTEGSIDVCNNWSYSQNYKCVLYIHVKKQIDLSAFENNPWLFQALDSACQCSKRVYRLNYSPKTPKTTSLKLHASISFKMKDEVLRDSTTQKSSADSLI